MAARSRQHRTQSTETPDLHGACEVVKADAANGYGVSYNDSGALGQFTEMDAGFVRGEVAGLKPLLSCGADTVAVTVQLNPACPAADEE